MTLGFSSPQIWQQEVFDKHGLLETQNQISSIEKRFVELMRAFITSLDDMVAAQERKTLLSIQGVSFIIDSLQYKLGLGNCHIFQRNLQHLQTFFKKTHSPGNSCNADTSACLYTISLSKSSNIQHKTTKTLNIQHPHNIWRQKK